MRLTDTFVFIGFVLLAVWALYQSAGPPDLEVVVLDIRSEPGRYHVAVAAQNHGAHMATHVRVHAELHEQGWTENAETTIPYLAGGSMAWTSLHFQHDPHAAVLTVSPASYETR